MSTSPATRPSLSSQPGMKKRSTAEMQPIIEMTAPVRIKAHALAMDSAVSDKSAASRKFSSRYEMNANANTKNAKMMAERIMVRTRRLPMQPSSFPSSSFLVSLSLLSELPILSHKSEHVDHDGTKQEFTKRYNCDFAF